MALAPGERMAMAPAEQRSLLRIERSLGKDPGVSAALREFARCQEGFPLDEGLSPWHPFLWRAVPVALTFATLSAVALITAGAFGAI
jgi:hypothetical protein